MFENFPFYIAIIQWNEKKFHYGVEMKYDIFLSLEWFEFNLPCKL
jgi:hypothetical protein